MKPLEETKREEVEAMRETLKIMGTKSEGYYDKCSDEQIGREYDAMTKNPLGGF